MKKYDTYKPSEIRWLGQIPEHWNIRRTKDILSNKKYPLKTGPFGTQLKGNDLKDEGNTCVYSQRNVIDNQFNEFKYFVDDVKAKELANFYVLPNDILITTRGTIGKASRVPENAIKGILHPCLITLRTNSKVINSDWLLYYLNDSGIFQTYISAESGATTIEVIYSNTLSNFIQILPPLEEQTAISKYLDAKTQAIDKKINLLTKKAETYKELRKRIIKDAVCKGLDKKVKLKESGVDWIGKIPEHWVLKRLKDIVTIYNGYGFPIDEQGDINGIIPFYKVSDINGTEKYLESCNNYVSTDTCKMKGWKLIPKNSIIVAKIGEALKKNHRKICVSNCLIDNNCMAINTKYNPSFSFWLFVSLDFSIFDNMGTVPSLSTKAFAGFILAIPPKEEQTAIANYLDDKTQKIDAIVSNIGKQIDTLKELRKTLINDVVTGKVKVVNI